MNNPAQSAELISRSSRYSLVIVFFALLLMQTLTDAQTFQVIHNFTGAADGSMPYSGVVFDSAGNLYGATSGGGSPGEMTGAVYELKASGSGWVVLPLYDFGGRSDGETPVARVVFGPDGALYGTTDYGGAHNGGTVFRLTPPARPCQRLVCPWTKSILYSFGAPGDGTLPSNGDLIFDSAGNIYGTTLGTPNCTNNCGTVYKLIRSGNTWTESVLYTFSDQSEPHGGVVFDRAGNLYGTTKLGGANFTGSVYELSPSGSGWTRQTIYSFSFYGTTDGQHPLGGLTFDAHGNLYGTTPEKGPQGGGAVFDLTPSAGNWTFSALYGFPGPDLGPTARLTVDGQGNVYGTSYRTGGYGLVFRLAPSSGGWIYTTLHDFSGPDGDRVASVVTLDAHGNLYGTTLFGGTGSCYQGCGVAWEIVP